MSKDVRKATATMNEEEARFLVDMYYQMQDGRIRSSNQISALNKEAEKNEKEIEPHETIGFFSNNYHILEKNLKSCLQEYAEAKDIGKWMMSITGIGPVIAAGLMAHIDINKVQTAGQIQAYAGLDPTKKWKKGEKRPWNPKLKTLCWKIGQSFIKVSNKEESLYGKIYKERREYEEELNNSGAYAAYAKEILDTKNFKNMEIKKIYESGKLPPAHITARCARYATKIFISHLFTVWYQLAHGEPAPKPYPMAILGHAHEILPPHFENGKVVIPEKK